MRVQVACVCACVHEHGRAYMCELCVCVCVCVCVCACCARNKVGGCHNSEIYTSIFASSHTRKRQNRIHLPEEHTSMHTKKAQKENIPTKVGCIFHVECMRLYTSIYPCAYINDIQAGINPHTHLYIHVCAYT